ncbi:NAD(P)H-dependent FAD/FMN reductase [Poriferisphaera corsica]|uniref:NAD(P)H-dependent FAD/FMN reductase n=1 Tax=Poriferisphaera corsica TaxID=2528020 RepID=A0A517YV42_9BACT|nr:NADPH-dependent FMN reductase [Poriferisphaera corsica]QDU34108.1 NAD(P)H-dependent FAD/FMN reductase [Poriferisphaera corsica]
MSSMNTLIISCSLNPKSRSAILAQHASDILTHLNIDTTLLDLREWDIPFCDASSAYAHPSIQKLTDAITAADAVLLAIPIYNYDANAAAKNLIELTGKAWTEKIVGFLCSAGGHGSYMSVMPLANSLMLDFRSLILPRFVYALESNINHPDPTNLDAAPIASSIDPHIDDRIRELCSDLIRLTHGWIQPHPMPHAHKKSNRESL